MQLAKCSDYVLPTLLDTYLNGRIRLKKLCKSFLQSFEVRLMDNFYGYSNDWFCLRQCIYTEE